MPICGYVNDINFHGFNALDVFLCCVVQFRVEGIMKGILGFTEDDVVSTDFVGDCR